MTLAALGVAIRDRPGLRFEVDFPPFGESEFAPAPLATDMAAHEFVGEVLEGMMRNTRGGRSALSSNALREGQPGTSRIDSLSEQIPRGAYQLVGLGEAHFRKCSQDEAGAFSVP